MTCWNCRKILVAGAALGLAACGGGGGSGLNSTPTPTPTPTPAPITTAIIGNATTSQEFAVKGATGTSTAPADQLRVRYDAASNAYYVQLPSSATWDRLRPYDANSFQSASVPQFNVQKGIDNGYDYSALAEVLYREGEVGAIAFGIATPAGSVAATGSATFEGSIFGQTNETFYSGLFSEDVPGNIYGDIDLDFNFGAGTLSGSISPILYIGAVHDLPTMQFTNTVYSTGSTTFSGQFVSTLSGANSFSGLFTGPAAQELIGSFAFPYKSPADNKNYQAAGAFVGKRQ